jgi:lysophospholipase L1-like esterase
MKRASLVFSFLFAITLVSGQDSIQFRINDDHGLVDYSKNIINNPAGLNPFFQKLLRLKIEKNNQVNILHIGDSHVQADYQTNQLRQNFQHEFGNAGRGFLIPARVAQTNEPNNYVSQSNNTWEAKRIVFPDQPLPTGLGGVSIRSTEENASLNFTIKNYPDFNYSSTKITAYFLQEPRSFNLIISDSSYRQLAYMGSFSTSNTRHSATITLPYPTNNFTFRTLKSLPAQDRITFFGFNLQNENPGIIYHAIGANGAKFKHYLANDFFIEQTASLSPDLIIIALGTNEALDHPYFDPKFPAYLDELIQKLKKQNPSASLLMSIPPDSYKRKNKRNPGVTNIRDYLLNYAKDNKIPFYDLYDAGGGTHSADKWRKAEFLRDDGVHFTRQGYELQGNMLYDALTNAYNSYVSDRH